MQGQAAAAAPPCKRRRHAAGLTGRVLLDRSLREEAIAAEVDSEKRIQLVFSKRKTPPVPHTYSARASARKPER